MENKFNYDAIIIGGGITGATVLWDATLRGIRCLLVEKNDFASGTTQATSKLIHGGLRYLKNGELSLVRESLRERKYLAKISPHSVSTMGFAIPVYSRWESLVLHAGMEVYNALSWDRNQGITEDCRIPRYSFWDFRRATHELPRIHHQDLKGAFLYYDYANTNPERHSTEFLFSAREKGAQIQNYTEVRNIEKLSVQPARGYRVGLYNRMVGKSSVVTTRTVVNCGGPWADRIQSLLIGSEYRHLSRSKGIHIVTRKINQEHSVILKKRDGTHLFVIPWRGKTIVGTTDTLHTESPDQLQVTRSDILNLLDEVNHAYGYTKLTEIDVDYYYGGLRPLVEDSSRDFSNDQGSYNASRRSEVIDHKGMGYPGFITAMGGKYTTSRQIAETVTDRLAEYLPGSYKSCQTKEHPLLGGHYSDRKTLCQDLAREFPYVEGGKLETLAGRYGSIARSVLRDNPCKHSTIDIASRSGYLLSGGEILYPEEVAYIARRECVHFATDFFFRRSGAGNPGLPPSVDGILNQLARELGWKKSRIRTERQSILDRYKIVSDPMGSLSTNNL